MASFLGGKVLGGLSGSTSANAINASTGAQATQAATPGFLQAGTPVSTVASATPAANSLATKFLGSEAANTGLGFGTTGATKGGAFTAAQQGFIPGMIGQTMTDAQLMQQEYENRAAKKDDDSTVPMPNPMRRTYNPNPYAGGGGEGTYFQYARPPRADGSQVNAPYYYADGGIMSLQEGGGKYDRSGIVDKALELFGDASDASVAAVIKLMSGTSFSSGLSKAIGREGYGESRTGRALSGLGFSDDSVRAFESPSPSQSPLQLLGFAEGGEMEADQMMAQNGMNEKDVIVSAIEAIKGMSEQPEIVLALFVQKYGEDALRDLVGRVQSGELDDTVDRFESGDKGMVRGPGDGSGVDDMVPATLEGEQDVLLSDGEFVLREKTTDALEKAYGGGFLDMVNRAEEDAPKKLQQMVG
jgi:hypothetical protein